MVTVTDKKYTLADGDSVPFTLKKSQRSDCCSSTRALYRVTFSYGDLYFCRHHFNKHKDKLIEDSLSVLDESNVLYSN